MSAKTFAGTVNSNPLEQWENVVLEERMPEVLVKVLTYLRGIGVDEDISVIYFSSRDQNINENFDTLRFDKSTDLIEAQVSSLKGGESERSYLKNLYTIDEYVRQMTFPESISFVEITYPAHGKDNPVGIIAVNSFAEVLSDMERVELGNGSYITRASAVQKTVVNHRIIEKK